ncbi:MAG: 4Fe-4S binding protein [Lentisphaeria bacterium]
MKRKIIKISEELCNGCGVCIPNCPEGALQLIDGKARLISDLFCDGLGACVGDCPLGAISVEEREAEAYDERRVMESIIAQGPNTIKAHLQHLKGHGEEKLYAQAVDVLRGKNLPVPVPEQEKLACGCPGTLSKVLEKTLPTLSVKVTGMVPSELRQWPVQLALLNPQAAYFEDADLLISADCVAHAIGDFHQQLLAGRILIIFCPKLDQRSDDYAEKLAEIFRRHKIRSITVAKMEVPCCGGTVMILQKALELAGKQIAITVHTVGIDGLISTEK